MIATNPFPGTTPKRAVVEIVMAALCSILFLFILSSPCLAEDKAGGSPQAIILQIQGAIGPASSQYFLESLENAQTGNTEIIILQIDTPGGLDLAMRDMIQAILNSPIPVASYVFPDGARAASAGTYILYASHIAAMAPATNLGAATPIQLGKPPAAPSGEKDQEEEQNKEEQSSQPGTALERKMVNDAAAYIRALAKRHGRNSEWAEKAVREAVSLSADEALELKVIDIVASDVQDLLHQINGRTIIMDNAQKILRTTDLELVYVEPGWKDKLLAIISNPNVAYLLLLLGMYGLIYELANPGVFFPGVAGMISLLLALYGFQVLPVNYSGLALLLLGITLMISEAFVPSFGSLGIGGIISFVIGSLILFDEETIRISRSLIGTTTILSATFIFLLIGRMLTLRSKKIATGREALIGMTGEVIEDCSDDCRIWLLGESWQVKCSGSLQQGEMVQVTEVDGLVLTVEKLKEI